MKHCIVIAWVDEEVFVHPMKRTVEIFREPRACTWLLCGGDKDLAKARSYAKKNGYSVLVYPKEEKEPLKRAREDILRG